MAGNQDSGDKTERATPKKLRDARKKGDVAKSKDLTSTLGLIFSVGILWMATKFAAPYFSALMTHAFQAPASNSFNQNLSQIGSEAIFLFMAVSAFILIPISIFGLFLEFLQVGPLFTFEKTKLKMSNLSLTEGLKRMFAMDNVVEVLKSISKTSILVIICWISIKGILAGVVHLPAAEPGSIVDAVVMLSIYLFGWTFGVFLLITAMDVSYQHYSFGKKMKMSIRDIKQEYKDAEGDPLIKSHRRQTAQEWAQQSAADAASSANVLVVNPTHIAIAIDYDREITPVPTVAAKGEEEVARAMREAAQDAGVPIVRNKQLARLLLSDAEEGEIVPRALFDTVAEVILWAQNVHLRVAHEKEHKFSPWSGKAQKPPGEDLTHYPSEPEHTKINSYD